MYNERWDIMPWVVADYTNGRILAGFRYLHQAMEFGKKQRQKHKEHTIVVIDNSHGF